MKKINLSIGNSLNLNDRIYVIKKQIDLNSLLVVDTSTNKSSIIEIKDIETNHDKLENKNITIFSDKEWDEAKKRLELIKPLLNIARKKEDVDKIARENNLHISTLYRWLKAYENCYLLSSLIPKTSQRGGKGSIRINEESNLILNKVIEDLYLDKQKLTPKQIHTEIKRRCNNAKVTIPHENTVRNRIKALEDKKKLAARESRKTADRLYRNTDGMFPAGTYPLDVIQIDHTPIDIRVVDEEFREVIGRPYLTLAIDVYSRMIMGYYISLEEPSYFSVSQCLTNMILPKEKILREYEINGDWDIWGIPRAIHVDNAQEFRSIELQRVCEELNISIEWRPVARPQFGGHIERLIGTSMKEVHTLPGTTFSNIKQKGDYNPDKEASLTLYELEKWLTEFIVNIYHKRLHSSINMSPEKKYELGIFGNDNILGSGLPEKLENEDYFRITLLPSEERTIQQFGVIINKIQYYHDVLRKWIRAKDPTTKKARKFIFKIDPRDISQIWFFDPDIKDYFVIPYRNISLPSISIWELRSIRKYLEEKHTENIDENIIFAAYEKMQKIKDEAIKKTRTIRKQNSTKKAHDRKKNMDYDNTNLRNDIEKSKNDSLNNLFSNVEAFEEIDIGNTNEN